MKAYFRVSPNHQHDPKKSLSTQTIAVRKIYQGPLIIYQDTRTIKERLPALEQLLRELESGDLVYCTEETRLAKDPKRFKEIYEIFKEKRARLNLFLTKSN